MGYSVLVNLGLFKCANKSTAGDDAVNNENPSLDIIIFLYTTHTANYW